MDELQLSRETFSVIMNKVYELFNNDDAHFQIFVKNYMTSFTEEWSPFPIYLDNDTLECLGYKATSKHKAKEYIERNFVEGVHYITTSKSISMGIVKRRNIGTDIRLSSIAFRKMAMKEDHFKDYYIALENSVMRVVTKMLVAMRLQNFQLEDKVLALEDTNDKKNEMLQEKDVQMQGLVLDFELSQNFVHELQSRKDEEMILKLCDEEDEIMRKSLRKKK